MKQLMCFLFLFLYVDVQAMPPTVTGQVFCNGVGIEGVSVSDGVEIVTTDEDGNYKMNSAKKYGLVWISVPSGYEVGRLKSTPRFFVHLSGEGCETIDFELTEVPNDDFTLFVFTDTHIVNDPEFDDVNRFKKLFLSDITQEISNCQNPTYSVCLGDMTTDGRWYITGFRLPEWDSLLQDFPIPVYTVMGNHDNDKKGENERIERDWDFEASRLYRETLGPQYYSLNIGQFHFVMLDNIIPIRPFERKDNKITSNWLYKITDEQFAWLEKDLALIPHTTPLVICIHAPVFRYDKNFQVIPAMVDDSSERLIEMVQSYRSVDIMSGHTHANNNIRIAHNIREHNQTSVSGVSWFFTQPETRLMSADGTHGGYQIYTFKGKELSWIYKINSTSVEESQFMVFDLNTIPAEFGGEAGSNRVLIDVFNWCDGSQLRVCEEGRELMIDRAKIASPLYQLVRKQELPARPTSFLGYPSSHMFEVETTNKTSTLEVIFTDPFGRRFTQTIERPKEFRWDMK